MKPVLLIVGQQGFQPTEFRAPKEVLEAAGIPVSTASNAAGKAISGAGEEITVDIAIIDAKPEDYSGIFLIGGGGAKLYLEGKDEVATLIQRARDAKMPYGAICYSPRILARAGALRGKRATGWNEDMLLPTILEECGAIPDLVSCVTDGNVVTADGPRSAEEFGKAIVSLLKK